MENGIQGTSNLWSSCFIIVNATINHRPQAPPKNSHYMYVLNCPRINLHNQLRRRGDRLPVHLDWKLANAAHIWLENELCMPKVQSTKGAKFNDGPRPAVITNILNKKTLLQL